MAGWQFPRVPIDSGFSIHAGIPRLAVWDVMDIPTDSGGFLFFSAGPFPTDDGCPALSGQSTWRVLRFGVGLARVVRRPLRTMHFAIDSICATIGDPQLGHELQSRSCSVRGVVRGRDCVRWRRGPKAGGTLRSHGSFGGAHPSHTQRCCLGAPSRLFVVARRDSLPGTGSALYVRMSKGFCVWGFS